MSLITILEVLGVVLGAVGGLEFVKYILHRRQNQRLAETNADNAELALLIKHQEFTDSQLLSKDEQLAKKDEQIAKSEERHAEQLAKKDERLKEWMDMYLDQTRLVRQLNSDKVELLQENAELKLKLQQFKCVVRRCENRDPQNGY